jgi:hypothetical protein
VCRVGGVILAGDIGQLQAVHNGGGRSLLASATTSSALA